MYYIMNQNNHIIAADDTLLSSLHIDDIDTLNRSIILGEIHFESLDNNQIAITTPENKLVYTGEYASLFSMLGNLQLVHLEPIVQEEKADISSPILDDESTLATSITEPEESMKNQPDEALITIKESIATDDKTEISLPPLDDLISPKESPEPKEKENLSDNELFDLTIPNEPQETIDEIKVEEEPAAVTDSTLQEEVPSIPEDEQRLDIMPTVDTAPVADTTPIVIHVDEVSGHIGISPEDYKTFLDEYIDTAISLESNLKSVDKAERTSAISTLAQLADVLELPTVNGIIGVLNGDASQELIFSTVKSFYATLSRLTTEQNTVEKKDNVLEEPMVHHEEMILKEAEPELEAQPKGFGTLDLSDVKPIHFDFRLEEAAEDLSLPVELIEEFVHDFIDQAHTETDKMLAAYEAGDLETIQKIGHLLKGASSNLRINPLSDTLYAIQFCADSSKLEDLITRYWGHFLSLEKQIDVLSN